jgi:hypothetical protein
MSRWLNGLLAAWRWLITPPPAAGVSILMLLPGIGRFIQDMFSGARPADPLISRAGAVFPGVAALRHD